jgi:hypothetical protein
MESRKGQARTGSDRTPKGHTTSKGQQNNTQKKVSKTRKGDSTLPREYLAFVDIMQCRYGRRRTSKEGRQGKAGKARQEGEGARTMEGRSSHLQQGEAGRGRQAEKRDSCQTVVGRYLEGRKKKMEEERRERGIYMCACSESALAPFLFWKRIGHKLAREPSRTMHIPY